MTDNAKRTTLTFLLLAVIVTILIAAALPQLKLKPAIPLPTGEGGTGRLPTEDTLGVSISVNTFFKVILEVIVVLILVYSGYKFLKGVPWKESPGAILVHGCARTGCTWHPIRPAPRSRHLQTA